MPDSPAAAAGAAWTWSDAWVLAAIMIRDGGDGCSLTEVVAAADAINHAILLDAEVEQAVRRLLGAGLVRVGGRRFFLTEPGKAMQPGRQTNERKRGGFVGQVGYLQAELSSRPVAEVDWVLEPGELERAVRGWDERTSGGGAAS